jgi:hypothetical protein
MPYIILNFIILFKMPQLDFLVLSNIINSFSLFFLIFFIFMVAKFLIVLYSLTYSVNKQLYKNITKL